MGGFFGIAKHDECINELFYGVDYNSHMGTKRAGIATCNNGVFTRSIHNIENSYFRSKFEGDLKGFFRQWWASVSLVTPMPNLLL